MKYFAFTIFSVIISMKIYADGIIIPKQDQYPYEYLKNKVTDVTVEINGLIAETIVYQEFENEWNQPVDGVYSFPLPLNARVTRLQYSLGDTLVDAILKVKPQSTNPGTGEGGIVAEINKYMGNNVIRLALNQIPAQGIKSVQLSYILSLNQFNGIYQYNYPLSTGDFIKHPLDYLKLRIKVYSSKNIINYDIPSHPDYHQFTSETNYIDIEYYKAKAYTATDVQFYYQVANSPFDIDLYSWKPNDEDGYFTLVGKPQIESADSALSQHIIFLLSNSTTMIGNKLSQSKKAISLAISELSPKDSFNILICNNEVNHWQTNTVPATSNNITDAQNFISTIAPQSGNRLDIGLKTALYQLNGIKNLSSILAFYDGKSPIDPDEIEKLNTRQTGIYIVAIGNDIDRVRLEAVTAQNFGFVSYINENNILASEMVNIFKKIKSPILKEVNINFNNALIHSLLPKKLSPVFAGTDFLMAGRYQVSSTVSINFEGIDKTGENITSFEKDFNQYNELSRKTWAKLAIDDLESQLLIYGENDTLKNQLINLSLSHNIRCRYTSYNEDTTFQDDEYGDGDGEWTANIETEDSNNSSESKLLMNYPNPFNSQTILKLQIAKEDAFKTKTIELYDLQGRLLKLFDITSFHVGTNELILNLYTTEFIINGIFIVHLKVDDSLRSTIKMVKMN